MPNAGITPGCYTACANDVSLLAAGADRGILVVSGDAEVAGGAQRGVGGASAVRGGAVSQPWAPPGHGSGTRKKEKGMEEE